MHHVSLTCLLNYLCFMFFYFSTTNKPWKCIDQLGIGNLWQICFAWVNCVSLTSDVSNNHWRLIDYPLIMCFRGWNGCGVGMNLSQYFVNFLVKISQEWHVQRRLSVNTIFCNVFMLHSARYTFLAEIMFLYHLINPCDGTLKIESPPFWLSILILCNVADSHRCRNSDTAKGTWGLPMSIRLYFDPMGVKSHWPKSHLF